MTQPKTQPHYGGWALYDELMAKIPLLPNTNTAIEHLRGDLIKRMGRFGGKDEPILEVGKAIAQIEKLMLYYAGSEFPLLEYPKESPTGLGVLKILQKLPGGFDMDDPIDRLRLEIIVAAIIGEFTPKMIQRFNALKSYFVDTQRNSVYLRKVSNKRGQTND